MDALAFKKEVYRLKASRALVQRAPLPSGNTFTVNGRAVLLVEQGGAWQWSLADGTVLDSSSYPGRVHALQAALRWTASEDKPWTQPRLAI